MGRNNNISFLIDAHPIFFVLSLIIVIFVLIAIAMISEFYDEFKTDEDFQEDIYDLPIINWIMTNLFMIILFISLTGLIALYAKSQ